MDINGKPMIQHVYENVLKANLDDVVVACDHMEIFECVEAFDGKAIMTSVDHINGTSRIAEVAKKLEADVILNVQGDEPLIDSNVINRLLEGFKDPSCQMATLKTEIINNDEVKDPNCVKVITDMNNNAIYFSRYPLPYLREEREHRFFKHIGIYAYRKDFLIKYVKFEPTPLELCESLEQLRVLENGYKIKILETSQDMIGIDTPEDLDRIREILNDSKKN
nr:3-deoxy-manno-octulosonate cytidylyltransferase [Candidatus Contubernalis alkalaceticus]